MPKKKRPSKIDANETIHFRPGRWLGEEVAAYAEAWEVSRGEAAKRMAELTICGLALDSHEMIDEISELTSESFGKVLQHVYTEVRRREAVENDVFDPARRKQVVAEVLEGYRLMHGKSSPDEQQRHIRNRHYRR